MNAVVKQHDISGLEFHHFQRTCAVELAATVTAKQIDEVKPNCFVCSVGFDFFGSAYVATFQARKSTNHVTGEVFHEVMVKSLVMGGKRVDSADCIALATQVARQTMEHSAIAESKKQADAQSKHVTDHKKWVKHAVPKKGMKRCEWA